ncbi:MAG TPA: cellulose binding domain-containing protein [Acetivibrio sp.]|nr:cellulose binding domain-containing protein [Acetivibrio sp.]
MKTLICAVTILVVLAAQLLLPVPAVQRWVAAASPELNPGLRVQFYNALRNDTSNTINAMFRIVNEGGAPIELDKVKLRYYYTIDKPKSQQYACDWSHVGSGNVEVSIWKMVQLADRADYYFEVGFKSSAGVLEPGKSIEVQLRVWKSDWSNYQQTNDYSFNVSASSYIEWERVTGYIDGVLVWGTDPEPSPVTPGPTQTPGLCVQFYNSSRNDTSNQIYAMFRIVNEGDEPIELDKVKIRYYYTIDGEKSQQYACDWSHVGRENVEVSIWKMVKTIDSADYYFEVGFKSSAGVLEPWESIDVQIRIWKSDWSNYQQSNDYSFNGSANDYTEWEKVTGYIDGVLVWGIDTVPSTPTPSPTPTATVTPTATATVTLSPTPTPTQIPVYTPMPADGEGLRGEYYNNKDFTGISLIRIDPTVNFDWGGQAPNTNMESDTFSVRWIGEVLPKYSEEYTFYTVSDDGVRLWVDNVLIIDDWTDHSATENSGKISLFGGKKYDIRMEFYENDANAVAKLYWSSDSQTKEIIPKNRLFPPKMFSVVDHSVRSNGNNFVVGDYIPLQIKCNIMRPVSNPVIDIDLSVKKPDGSDSGFLLKEIISGTEINKNYIKVYRNSEELAVLDYTAACVEAGLGNRRLRIRVLKDFSAGEQLEVRYFVKASAKDEVFSQGIDRYLELSGLKNAVLKINFTISEWYDSGLKISTPYTADSTKDSSEKQAFRADIVIKDPVILE